MLKNLIISLIFSSSALIMTSCGGKNDTEGSGSEQPRNEVLEGRGVLGAETY